MLQLLLRSQLEIVPYLRVTAKLHICIGVLGKLFEFSFIGDWLACRFIRHTGNKLHRDDVLVRLCTDSSVFQVHMY